MNIEQKAKAYDEALNWMRELYPGLHGATKEDAEHYFPELRESEDERIRKEIVGVIQKHYPNTPESYRWISWLEKQKENHKSADSIPADCTSDAKCEDRWKKVADSLPENPREVLCKDEAGNYFIGRYYVGEGWEISNYDDEDKPHHLNPPVSKWIDFPSEKQKEQKSIESIAAEVTKDKESAIKFLKSAGIMDDNGELAEMYRSEPKPAENDTRTKIISRATSEKQVVLLSESDGNAEIGWDTRSLEDTKKLLEYGLTFINGQLGKQKKQKSVEWSEEQLSIIDYLINLIDEYYKEPCTKGLLAIGAQCFLRNLKSLRPQPQQNMSISFMLYLDEHRPDGKMCLSNAECNEIETAFKNQSWDTILRYIEKYQPHWKPNEYTLSLVKKVADGEMLTGVEQMAMGTLYEQLKSL